jgi:L-alanine-DL-glutamate epimerase-like enolase superfamily enzyme
MKITDVRAAQIESHRFLLVKVYTNEGIVGVGEGSGLTGALQWIPRLKRLLIETTEFPTN